MAPSEDTDEAPMGIVIDGEGELFPPGDDNLHVTFTKEKPPKEKATANIRKGIQVLRDVLKKEDLTRAAELNEAAKSLEQFLADTGM